MQLRNRKIPNGNFGLEKRSVETASEWKDRVSQTLRAIPKKELPKVEIRTLNVPPPIVNTFQEGEKEFIEEVNSMVWEFNGWENVGSYVRIWAISDIYQFLDANIDKFKDSAKLKGFFDTVRAKAVSQLSEIGILSMQHGKDHYYKEAIKSANGYIISSLSKLGPG